jgi:diaminohydroxyphosphoribosylaminopyrimidine deaminase/5-amino-6-(5-phosphoribosylamino)uracil reductase
MNVEFTAIDTEFMHQALALSTKGGVFAAPNPMVGCVIVKNGQVIGSGYHEHYGQAHAEVNALSAVQEHVNCQDATAYVTLEPCAHYGKTPPCAVALINARVSRVVIAILDPNPLVAGRGIGMLKDAGIKVDVGLCAAKAIDINRRFLISTTKQRPYVTLKWAQSSDKFFCSQEPKQVWLTCEASRKLVHRWRSEEQAILIGGRTAQIDNPSLTVRLESGRNPTRIILDRVLSIPQTYHVYDKAAPTIFVNELKEEEQGDHQFWRIPFDGLFISKLIQRLHSNGYNSLLVEGGAQVLRHFIESGFYDEARILTSTNQLIHGVNSPNLPLNHVVVDSYNSGTDLCEIYRTGDTQVMLDGFMPLS